MNAALACTPVHTIKIAPRMGRPGIAVAAEGVKREDKPKLACKRLQGYYFGRAIPTNEEWTPAGR